MHKPLKTTLKFKVLMELPGFETLYSNFKPLSPKSVSQLQFNEHSFEDNYYSFKEKIIKSINNKYLPVYRMADGEFLFTKCLTREKMSFFKKIFTIISNFKKILKKQTMYGRIMPTISKEQLQSIFDPYYFRVAHNESYTKSELKKIKNKYIDDLSLISKNGFFAMHFIEYLNLNEDGIKQIDFVRKNVEYSNQIELVMNWIDNNNIDIDSNNYTSFYNIYALLTGPDRYEVFKNRKVLIITSASKDKKINIENNLKKLGISSLQFYDISPNKSMFAKLDLSQINSVDLVLVGAGIGSSNILAQCEDLNTVCIDAGIVLECYNNPKILNTRLFLHKD
jgi:hypothetical protein